ncbi:DoxX family protein [bacterium]|nr:DoxX family protein [bacterium]
MNILLWVLQAVLALQAFAGGAYKIFKFDDIAQMPVMAALPRSGWGAVGVLEMVCAVLLIVPAATKWMPVLTPIAAAVLVLESLALAGLYGRHSLQLSAANPLVYVLVGAALAAVVAYGRYAFLPKI